MNSNKWKLSGYSNIFNNVAWMIFDKVIILALNLLVTVKIANYYGAEDYGTYQYIVSLVALFEILVAFVDGRVVKKKYVDYQPENVVTNATFCRIFFSIISVLVAVVYMVAAEQDRQFSVMLFLLILKSVLINLRFGFANRYEYLLKSRKIVIAADIGACLGAIMELCAVRMKLPITAIAVISLLQSGINLLIIVIQYKHDFTRLFGKTLDQVLIKEMVKESFPLAIAASCATIYTRCDSVMIGSMLNQTEVGIYSISIKLISIVQIVLIPIRESVYPRLIRLYNEDRVKYEREYIKISSIMTWLYIIGVSISFIVLPNIFDVLNKEYMPALSIYRIHVLGTFFMYNAILRAGHFTLTGDGRILALVQFISVIVNVFLNIVGIHLLGTVGAAVSTVVTQGISLMLSNVLFEGEGRKVFKWQIRALNPLEIFN
ncbi:MAG: flippase [Eubacteriales bacterium]|nr:flippase [Eubacteriales bacterium]